MSEAVQVDEDATGAAARPTATAELVMEEGHLMHPEPSGLPVLAVTDTPEATATAVAEDPTATAEHHTDLILSADAEPIASTMDLEEGGNSIIPGGRAEFISVTFLKKTAGIRLGIVLRENDDGTKYISKLRSDSPLSFSPLKVGDKVLSINNKCCIDFERGAAAELLRQLVGTITIVAHNIGGNAKLLETMVEKENGDSTVGIGVRRNTRGSLEVSKVSASGLFAHSLVNIGDRLIAVNNVGCNRLDPTTALDIVRSTPRYVTLLTETQHETAFVLAAASDHPGALELETVDATAIHDNRRFQSREQACFCIWMIILSLSFISIAIYRGN